MDFPTADNYSYVKFDTYEGDKCLKLHKSEWRKLSHLSELKTEISGLRISEDTSGNIRVFHKNPQSNEYWEQLKLWCEEQLN